MTAPALRPAALFLSMALLVTFPAPQAVASGPQLPAAPVPAAPAPAAPVPASRPAVTPTVTTIPAAPQISAKSVPQGAQTSTGTSVLSAVAPREVPTFQLVGATWASSVGTVALEVRTLANGTWSAWSELSVEETRDATKPKNATEPLYVGDATGVELRAVGAAGSSVTSLSALTVTSPTVAADSTLATVSAQAVTGGVAQPAIISRAAWGADESLRSWNGADCAVPKIDSTVKAAVIHHTAGRNDYTAAESASIVRGIYAYHVQGNGWCDIGYNFLVDKYGQIFEGRFGGITLPVHGAHATSWNTDTVGVSFMMNSSTMDATPASMNSAEALLAWKLGNNYRTPDGLTTLVGASRPVIFGHRDVMSTDCPGTNLYSRIPELRNASTTLIGTRTALYNLWLSTGGDAGTLGAVYELEHPLAGGSVVTFANGTGYQRPDGQAFWLGSGLGYLYTQQGGPTGALGWPTSSQVSADGIATATFEHGNLQYPMESGTTTFGSASTYYPITPARFLDTRITGTVGSNKTIALTVVGANGVPANATAVTLNLTVTNTKAPGFLTVWPTGLATPVVSNLNFVAGQTVPNLVTATVGTGGQISILNGSLGTSDVVVDIGGYYVAGAPTAGGGMVAVTPTRLLDTRSGLGAAGAAAPGADVPLTVRGGVVPADATAVLLNLTVDQTTSAGWVAAYPAGVAAPAVSNLNFVSGQTTANLALVKIGAGGVVMLRNGAPTATQLVADVVGYVTGSGTGGGFLPADQPLRILDTRAGIGVGGPVGGGVPLSLTVAGRSGVPSTGVKAVVLNVTAADITRSGFVTAFPSGQDRPNASNLNFRAGQVVANQVVVGVGPDGRIVLQNMSSGSLQLIADIAGYIV